MKILVCGDRNWQDADLIRNRLSQFPQKTVFLAGGCRGADRIAAEEMRALRYKVLEFPANWQKYGRVAGPIRNREMLDQKPGMVIAFHDDLRKSSGTADTVREAGRRGIPFEVLGHEITQIAGVCGGDPCLAGTRITMDHFEKMVKMGWTYEKILEEYPHLDPKLFQAAMSRWMSGRRHES